MFQNKNLNTTPIQWNNTLKAWTVSSYDEVIFILKDKRFSATSANIPHQNSVLPTIAEDPTAAQQELIQCLQQEALWVRQTIQETILFYCQQKSDCANLDLYQEIILPCCQELAFKLTDSTIITIEKKQLLDDAQLVFEGTNESQAATIRLSSYFLKKIALAKQQPSSGFVTLLAQTSAESYVILSPIIQLFVGIANSLPLLLSNSLVALLRNPSQQKKYLENPKQCLNELLRYAGPAKIIYRLVLEKTTLGNHTFERGDRVALFLETANLDEKQFKCPHQLDFSRPLVAHLSLGMGAHACLGASIIRTALELIPYQILKHFPQITLDLDKIVWGGSPTIQGATSLFVIKNL